MSIQIGQKPSPGYQDPVGLLSDCHRRVEMFLNALILVVDQAKGAGLNLQQREALETALRYFREAAPKHTSDEEESLFPRMRKLDDAEVKTALARIDALEADHRVASGHHAVVEQLGQQWLTQGRLSGEDTSRIKTALEELRRIYEHHISVEDHDIFPLARKVLSKAELSRVGQEMASRRGQDMHRLNHLFPANRDL